MTTPPKNCSSTGHASIVEDQSDSQVEIAPPESLFKSGSIISQKALWGPNLKFYPEVTIQLKVSLWEHWWYQPPANIANTVTRFSCSFHLLGTPSDLLTPESCCTRVISCLLQSMYNFICFAKASCFCIYFMNKICFKSILFADLCHNKSSPTREVTLTSTRCMTVLS